VGRHFIANALKVGLKLRVMVRDKSKLNDLTHSNLEVFEGSLGTNDAAFVKDCSIVLHMAGLIKARNRKLYDRVNVEAARKLAIACENEGVKRLVLLSSMAAREPSLSDYAASKAIGEEAIKTAFTGKLAIIRAPAVFGAGDDATAPFMAAILNGFLPVPGGRNWAQRKLSIVAVEDLVNHIINHSLKGEYDGKTVSPASIASLTWPEFATLASSAAERKVKAVPLPLWLLYPVAAITSITSRVFGLGHLTLGKLREFLHPDWSSNYAIKDAPPMQERLAHTLQAYNKAKLQQNGVG